MANVIPARYAQSVLQLLAVTPEQATPFLEQLALPATLLDAEPAAGTLDADTFGQLFIALVKAMQPQLLGDDPAEPVLELSSWRLLYSYMLQAKNLGEAIRRATTYYQRFEQRRQSFSLAVDDDTARWVFAPAETATSTHSDHSNVEATHFAMDRLQWLPGLSGRITALYTWHRLCCWMTGCFIDLDRLAVDFAREGDADDLASPFRAPVYFGQPRCEMCFHARYLALPIIRNETDLEALLATFPAELLRVDTLIDSTTAQVRNLLGNDFSQELPNLDTIASRLHMTTATLHRRLRNENTSYQLIKDTSRRDAAIVMLRGGGSGSDIATQLGFSDASTFFRAFKKWTGSTPQDFLKSER